MNIIVLIFIFMFQCWAGPSAIKPIINPVINPVIDDGHLLTLPALTALNQILLEHERATHERSLVILIPEETSKNIEAPDLWVDELIERTGISNRRRSQGIALVYLSHNKTVILKMFQGVEGPATQEVTDELLKTYFYPDFRRAKYDRAFIVTVIAVLRDFKSPIIESGRAQNILLSVGINSDFDTAPLPQNNGPGLWICILALIFLILGFAVWRFLQLERSLNRNGILHSYPKLYTKNITSEFKGGGSIGSW